MTTDHVPDTSASTRTVASLTLPEKYASLAGQRLLVTGAAGFIGGALLRRLAAYRLDVVGTVWRPEEAEALRREGFRCKVLDLLSDDPFDEYVQDIDIVFHVAAMFQETEYDEATYMKANRDGALKLCKAAAKAGVDAVRALLDRWRARRCQGTALQGDDRLQPDGSVPPHQARR